MIFQIFVLIKIKRIYINQPKEGNAFFFFLPFMVPSWGVSLSQPNQGGPLKPLLGVKRDQTWRICSYSKHHVIPPIYKSFNSRMYN